jgi:peptidyl-prolyl cis-trans isomerase B (cyclophilin B)
MPSEKRQRQDEGRLLRLEAERAAASRSQRSRQVRNIVILVLVLLAVAFAISVLTKDDEDTATDTTTTTVGDGEGEAVLIPIPAAGASITGETPCPAADGSEERTTTFAQAPPTCIDPTKTYTAVMQTSEGEITIELDQASAPIAVNNFVVLARYHYYDGVAFHRIVPGFVNQAGDAVGPTPGTGGPGYSLPEEDPADPATAYEPGTVAMARAAEVSGSQFFLVIGDENGALSGAGNYPVFGRITAGQDVSTAINALAVGEAPTKLVTIDSLVITES